MDIEIFKTIKDQNENSAELKKYIDSVGEKPLIEDFDGGRRYYNFSKTGVDLVFDDAKLVEVHLFTDRVKNNSGYYQALLPKSLNFSDSIDMVLKKLGPPDIIKEAIQNHKLLGLVYPWCKYLFDGYSIRIEFEIDKSEIRMVALA